MSRSAAPAWPRRLSSSVDELRMFRNPVVIGGGTPFLPPVTEDVPLDLIETRTFGSRVIYERYRRVRDDSD
jgi:riboflavin biosynthesis pyrimidine reductase